MTYQAPRGTRDILPPDSERWAEIEEQARRILGAYGYREVRTPIFESTDLFVRSVGESNSDSSVMRALSVDNGYAWCQNPTQMVGDRNCRQRRRG